MTTLDRMKLSLINIDILVLLYVIWGATVTGSDLSKCSCYTFYGNSSNWESSRSLCQVKGGDLVSIETLKEWEVIRKVTKNKVTKSGANQWWIGIQKKDSLWVWLNDNNLTYQDKWVNMNLNARDISTFIYAVIDKDTGQFWKAQKSTGSGKICEYKGKACTVNQTQWCNEESNIATSPHPTTTTTAPWTTTAFITTPEIVVETTTNTKRFTAANYPNTSSVANSNTFGAGKEKNRKSRNETVKPFPIVIFMVVLAVVLLVCVGVLIVVWINKSRKRGKHRLSHRRNNTDTKLELQLGVQNMYDHYPDDSIIQDNAQSNGKSTDNTICIHIETTTSIREVEEITKAKEKAKENGEVLSESTNYEDIDTDEKTKTEEETEEREDQKEEIKPKLNLETFSSKQANNDDDDVFYTEIEATQEENCVPGNLPDGSSSEKFTYATISDSENKEPSEAVYAELDDVEDNTDKKEVTYAEISDFNANADLPLKKPTPYHPTEYASVTVHPLSPREFDR